MFDINLIRKDLQQTKEKMQQKKVDPNLIQQIYDLDVVVRDLLSKEQNLNQERNLLSKQIGIFTKNKDPQLQETINKV